MDMIDHQKGEQTPLLSNRFLIIATSIICLLALASMAISIAGKLYGDQLSLAGHSESTRDVVVTIGRDRLRLTENTMRFESQRHSGLHEQIDLYLSWPSMSGFTRETRTLFESNPSPSLIFLQISQSTMSRDMSGRLDPIYRQLLQETERPGPAGLTGHSFKPRSGYDGESLYTAENGEFGSYAVRCLIETEASQSSGGDCQRDIHVGQDLTVLYRFPRSRLPDWKALETAIRSYVENRTVAASADPAL
ncbi:hypothetical protein ACSV9I_03690 [Rhizobium sp. G187]|uniref:hypothetical protein n=1 Tax=Rhizobium sp. G187 TaxID=3451352 RepID=UPI003EE6B5A8